MKDLKKIVSQTAKEGFRNEQDVINNFKIKGSFKSDIQVQVNIINIKLKELIDVQNLQVKLVSNISGFNQIDKRWIDKYVEMWNIPEDIVKILKYFTGEFLPYIKNPKDERRMFLNEFTEKEQKLIIEFIKINQSLIVSDILKGRGQFASEWMLVILKIKDEKLKWSLKSMNFCLNLFGNGNIEITKQGSLKIGNITVQRKGGDAGRKTAQMLQFKINPCLLFED